MSELKSGSTLTKEGTALPESVHTEPITPGWNLVQDDTVAGTEDKNRPRRLAFLYSRSEITGSATARYFKKALWKATERLIRQVEKEELNAIEIKSIIATEIFGLYFVTVVRHARQIQQSAAPPNAGLRENPSNSARPAA